MVGSMSSPKDPPRSGGRDYSPLEHDETATASLPMAAQSEQAFSVEQRIAERYRVVRFIARGGMGEVYEVEDLELHPRVALKTIRAGLTDPGHIQRFRREINLARKITHPNLCRIYDLGKHGDVFFLTMELLPGESLRARLRREGPMTEAQALPWIAQMGAALAAAHRQGIVHRDFKSDNVLLVEDRAVVTDFGLARMTTGASDAELATITDSGQGLLGSPAYMAPEQVNGREITTRADVYAFGIVLYEMVTGELPFVAATPLATAALRLTQAPRPPRKFAPGLSERWQDVILRCLDLDPTRRFATADEIVAALSHDGTVARTTPPATVSAAEPSVNAPAHERPIGGSSRTVLLSAAALTVLFGAAVAVWQLRQHSRSEHIEPPREARETHPLVNEGKSKIEAASVTGARDTQKTPELPPVYRCDKQPKPTDPDACDSSAVAWCDPDGKQVACCANDLVPTAVKSAHLTWACGCPPRGARSKKLVDSGCPRATEPEANADAIQAWIMEAMPQVKLCYMRALRESPNAPRGKVILAVRTSPDGRVFSARIRSSSLPSPSVQACIIEAMRTVRPAPTAEKEFVYPVVFDDDDAWPRGKQSRNNGP
jgi:serine/threonine protein kinase